MATFELIQSYTLTSITNGIEFDPIPQTFNHLWLSLNAKNDRANYMADDVRIIINNDANGSSNTRLYGTQNGVTQDGGVSPGQNYLALMNSTFNQNAAAFGGSNYIFYNYAGNQNPKTAFGFGGSTVSNPTAWQIGLGNYQRANSAPTTKIGVFGYSSVNGLQIGSSASLYGIKNT